MHIFPNAPQFASRTLIVQQLLYAHISPLPILLLGGEEQVVEWAYSLSSSRSGRSRFNGLARARPCQRESSTLFIASPGWLFLRAELAPSPVTSQDCREDFHTESWRLSVHFEELY